MTGAKHLALGVAVFFITLAGLMFVLDAPVADAAPKSQLQLAALLNGKPSYLGQVVLDGGSNTNASTLQPFTLTGGTVIKIECDAATRIGLQAACNDSMLLADAGADSTYCEALAVQPAQKHYVVPDDVTTIAAKGTPGKICVVWRMQ